MRYLTLAEVLALHQSVLQQSGGAAGVHDLAALESALAQPAATFAGSELHQTLLEKAAALCFSLVLNHPFIDGNKRVGHAAMETFLVLNGHEIEAAVDEQEQLLCQLADGRLSRTELADWLASHTIKRS